MGTEDKKWESGPRQETNDKRTDDQINRAKEEADRRNENLEDEPEGSYKEKNGSDKKQFDDLKDEPKLDVRPTHPQTDQ